jgi:hypothetical protein
MLATTLFDDRLCDPVQDHVAVQPVLHACQRIASPILTELVPR